jgi:hypothetical protein
LSPRAARIVSTSHAIERLDVAQTRALELGQRKTAALARQITQGVASLVTVLARVGRGTDADAVQDYDRSASQLRSPL